MKIALIGYGKMGREIEKIALERGHEIILKIHSKNTDVLNSDSFKEIDAAIEFSRPENAVGNIKKCFTAGIPVAVGTTGWYDEYDNLVKLCNQQKGTLLAASNFSVGVNLLFELNKKLAYLMNKQDDYSAKVEEIHHTEKLDSPSGTAITIAEDIIKQHKSYHKWINRASNGDELEIISYREPDVPGTHEISYESHIDKISLKHEAKNRKGFALGAVLAAEFIKDKQGVYTMNDVLNN